MLKGDFVRVIDFQFKNIFTNTNNKSKLHMLGMRGVVYKMESKQCKTYTDQTSNIKET